MSMESNVSADLSLVNEFCNDWYSILTSLCFNLFFTPLAGFRLLLIINSNPEGRMAYIFKNILRVSDEISISKAVKHLQEILAPHKKVEVTSVDNVYIMKEYKLTENFLKNISDHYVIQSLNFADPVNSANIINQCLEETTSNKIKHIVTSQDLNKFTCLLVVNAIYFNSSFLHKFNTHKTANMPFYNCNNLKVDVRMLYTNARLLYINVEEIDAEILALPFVDPDLNMIIILPHKRDGIIRLENILDDANLYEMIKQMQYNDVNVYLPKWNFEELIKVTINLNKQDLDSIYNLPRTNSSKSYECKIIQRIFIDINEKYEPANKTDRLLPKTEEKCSSEQRISFKVDRPFLFRIIIRKDPPITLFFGRMLQP